MNIVKKNLVIFLLILVAESASGQPLSGLLAGDIADGNLDNFSRIEAAFIISGADTSPRLQQGIEWYQSIVADVGEKNLIGFDRIPSAEKLFLYLHTTWLKKYQTKATTLFDILERKEYNCVAATVLYNLLCDELGLATEAFETPTHVYTIFSNVAQQVMVENTTSMGFNIMKNLKQYSQYLLKYYPENEALKIGLDRRYAHENANGRKINNTELLGLMAYNLAIFNAEDKNYEKAYDYVLLAQSFNSDSRSNRKFEISLYYRWGSQLFNENKFIEAFQVTADAYYRYPDNDDFKKNCQAAFMNALKQLWASKNWQKSESIILEMSELGILTDRETEFQKLLISDWIDYFASLNNMQDASKAIKMYQRFVKE